MAIFRLEKPHEKFLLFKTNVLYCSVIRGASSELQLMDARTEINSGVSVNCRNHSSTLQNVVAGPHSLSFFRIDASLKYISVQYCF